MSICNFNMIYVPQERPHILVKWMKSQSLLHTCIKLQPIV
jgi:hypothetical protein